MRIDIITGFPETFGSVFSQSIIKRAQEKKLVDIFIHNLRDFTKDKRRTIDGRPYGGGPGMILRAEPIFICLEKTIRRVKTKPSVYLLSPQGRLFDEAKAGELSKKKHLVLVCGHYEGFDERLLKFWQAEEISIGDYVLSGGEIPSMVVTDAVVRLIPGVLGKKESLANESFLKIGNSTLLDFPQYTRPKVFRKLAVPKILLSGHAERIRQWRARRALAKTRKNRPDLLGIDS